MFRKDLHIIIVQKYSSFDYMRGLIITHTVKITAFRRHDIIKELNFDKKQKLRETNKEGMKDRKKG